MVATGRFGVKLGLERVRALLQALGNPEAGMRGVLIAGTNGKGSTSAMVASILGAAGLRAGLMPSPHLSSYRERIQVDLEPISEREFANSVAAVRPAADGLPAGLGRPTEFEILIAVGVLHLAPRVDRFVCEVGLGGRLDATNVLDLGVAAVTNVSLDHQAQLGATIPAIAVEKAGIVKPGNRVVTGCEGDALTVIEAACSERDAPLWRLGREVRVHSRSLGWGGVELDVNGPGFEHRNLRVSLLGDHQARNAAVAVACAEAMGDATPASVRAGLARTRWPGRLEVVAESPRVVLDGAHNPAAMRALTETLGPLLGRSPLVAVFGAMADKALPELLGELRRLQPALVLTTAAASAGGRAAPAGRLAEIYGPGATAVPDAQTALAQALESAGPSGTVLVCGSLYLVGELRALRLRGRRWSG